MSLERVEFEEIEADVLNIGLIGLIPSRILEEEVDSWYEIINAKDIPVEHARREIAVVLHDETADNFKIGSMMEAIACHGLTDPEDREMARSTLRLISARLALSRLTKQLIRKGETYLTVGDELQDEIQDLVFLDQEYREAPPISGALSLVMPKLVMADELFFARVARIKQPEEWYVDHDTGLYVRAQIPAMVSSTALDSLAVAAKNRRRALPLFDPTNSVTLFPYMSNNHILATS